MAGDDGAGEDRGVGHVKPEALFFHGEAGVVGLGFSLGGEGDVMPAGEEVEFIPRALAVAQ